MGRTPRTIGRTALAGVGVFRAEGGADGRAVAVTLDEFLDSRDGGRPKFRLESGEGEMECVWEEPLLKKLPNIFLTPDEGGEILGMLKWFLIDDTDAGRSGIFDGDPTVSPPSVVRRALGPETMAASPQTSTGSRMARPITSNPRF